MVGQKTPGTALRPVGPIVDPRLFARAIKQGRVRGVATELMAAVLDQPRDADRIVRDGLRVARQLHSAERRLVGDGIYAWMRHGAWLERATGSDSVDQAWLGWLALSGPVEGVTLREPDLSALSDVEALAVWGNVDEVLADALIASVPDPIAFLVASNQRASLVLRANRVWCTREQLAERLAGEGVVTSPGRLAPDALIAEKSFDVNASASFRDGWFEVQDEGSQLVVAHGEPRGRVLDLCAGAGGKALHAASVGAGPIVACDVRRSALDELDRRSFRARVRITTRVIAEDVELPRSETVIVDAPCSGTGTLRRHPELRLRLGVQELARFPRVQRELIAKGAALVEPGGRLVYATCSVLRAENEDLVDAFLAGTPRFRRLKDDRKVRPETDGCDGMYVAVLGC